MPVHAMTTKLKIGADSIVGLTSISGLEPTADTIETTTLDSTQNFRTYIQGLRDGGEVSASGFFEPGDTTGQAAIYALFLSGAVTTFTILFPSAMGASWTFDAIVTSPATTGAEMEDLVSFEMTLKVTGVPALGTTASANLTALALTGTAGTLSPVFAGGTYSYSYSFTGTGLTVTATLTGATMKLYVDGEYIQDLTSASASASITFSAAGSKMLTIVEHEAGKTEKVYEVVAIRAS